MYRVLIEGLVPGLLGTTHGALQFMLYNAMKDARFRQRQISSDEKLVSVHRRISPSQATTDYLLFSSLSKVLATTVTFPYQVLRTRLQVSSLSPVPTPPCIRITTRTTPA